MVLEEDIPEPKEIPHSESMQEEGLIPKRKRRAFHYDPFEDIMARNADITFKQLCEISPAAKTILKQGLAQKPSYVNAVQPDPTTPAYATGEIAKRMVSCIIDTGAGISLISHALMELLNMGIDRASKSSVIMANGSSTVPLGVVEDVAISFGVCTVAVDLVVTEAASYDVILGMDWLTRANAKVDLGKREMTLSKHGQQIMVPLDVTRGIRTEITKQQDEESEDEQEEHVNVAHQGDHLDQHANEWRKFTKKPSKKPRMPKPSPPLSDDDDYWPKWQKDAADSYTDEEEEKYFTIPDQKIYRNEGDLVMEPEAEMPNTGGCTPTLFGESDEEWMDVQDDHLKERIQEAKQ